MPEGPAVNAPSPTGLDVVRLQRYVPEGTREGVAMRYIFGDYVLDTQRYEFHYAGEPVPLQPKAFQVLAYLLVHRDRVVLKQELLEYLWPGQFVGDAALNCYIMAVRQAVGDSGQAQRLIRTIRGRGYRFVAPVTVWEPAVPVEEQRLPLPVAPGHMDAPGPPAVPPIADAALYSAVSSAADGEYKLVTVLCCALADAPALAARLGSEAMYHVMQALLTLAQEVMQRYNGTLTHVTGEGFTALFGAPVAQEDHARRAVLAALLLRQHLGELPMPGAFRHESSLAVRTGIHTGQVVVGPLPQAPSHLYTAGGSTARLAPLLQQRATPGTILISAATQQLVQEEVQAAADGTIAVDGIPRPVSVYAVQGFVPRRAGVVGHGTRHQSPFVGRERELALLQATEFLYETRLFPVREYAFKHPLTHEVAYGSLLHERRRAVHTRIVEVLEAQHAERLSEHAERLAHHAVRGEVWEKALRYCRQAGAKAFARSANREAVAYCEQALGALRHLPLCRDTLEQAVDLRFDLHNALVLLEESERSADHLHEAETLAKRLGDQRRLARAAFYLSEYCRQMGDQTGALAAGQRALTLATALRECGLQAAMHFRQGQIYINLGEYRQALGCFGHSLALLHGEPIGERFGLPGVLAVLSRAWMARCLAELGEFDEGMAYGEEALGVAAAVDHPFSRIDTCYNVGYLYFRKGDLHKAILRLEQSLRVGRAADIRLLFVNVASTLGAAYALSGRGAEALPLLEQAVKQAVATNFRRARQSASLSEAYVRAGCLEEGRRHVRQALERARAHRERGHEAYAFWLLGEIATHGDPPEAAPAAVHYQQALPLAEALGMRPLQAYCHYGLGTLYAKIGRWEQARAELSAAMEMSFWLPQAEAVLAQLEAP